MKYLYVLIILLTQINYLYLSPTANPQKGNLRKITKVPKKNNYRKIDEQSEDIVIIHLNDVHCGFNDTIGYDGFALYRKELLKKYKYVLTVDVGDHSQGGALGAITNGEAVIEIMNKIGFDVVTIGNHEFDYGIEQLHKLNNMSITKYISLNAIFTKNNSRIFEPSKVIEVGNKKIGFIGIVTPLTFSKTYVSTLREEDGSPIYNFLSNKEEMYEKVQVEVDRLKNEQNVNYVILLTHIGMDVEEYTSNDIISHIEGVDAVLDGHTHKVYNTAIKDKNNKDIPITQTGTKLAYIGQLIISEETIINENINAVPEPDDDDKAGAQQVTRNKEERWVDTEMNLFIAQQFQKYDSLLNHKYGHSNYNFIIKPEDSSDSHQVYCRFQECTLGNFIADAFKAVVNADVSFVNGGSIRTNLMQGDIIYQNIVNVMPFFNSIFVKEITGQALLDALEFGVSNWPNAFGGFPQVSGCTYDIDVNIASTVEKDADGMFIRVGEQRRVSNVKINGEELDLQKKYNLSASEFILNGGDGYTMFAEFPIVNESIYADSDALAYHIQTNVEGEIPAEYNELQNRINIIKSDDIIIIHLNDVHCGFNDTIGYDGFMLYLKELRYKYNHVLAVDVGDHSQGGALGAITNGEAVIEIMNKIGFDVVTIGNHEFDYGIEQLHKLNEMSITKYISLNAIFTKNNSRIFEPSKIIEVGEKKIGFIGIVTPLTFSKTYISSLKEDDGSPIYNFLSNKEEMYEKVQEEVNRLRNNEHVNYVILLTHVGMNVEEYTSNDILSHLENVDAVLDGHTHMVYNTTSKDKNNKDIPITQTGTKLANIGELIIKPDGKIINLNIHEVPEPDDKTGAQKVTRSKVERWVDTEMNQFIAQQFEDKAELLNRIYGHSNYDFIIKPEDSSDSHAVYCRFQECTLGNFIADAFKAVVNADVSFVNGGSIRTNLLKGDIKYQNIVDVMPFYNSVFVKEITGQALLDALEFGVSNWPNAFGGFPQVSGCTYDVDTSIESTVEKDADGMFIRVGEQRRVSNVKINGEELDLQKKYNLSASEFILNGGDGYSMFAQFPIVNESIYADSDALAYHIQTNVNGEIPAEYNELQNRINIIKSDDIIIIHLNDVHCGFNDTIGYDGFALYRKELLKKYKYVLTVDVGDHSQGGALGAITNGEAVIEIMNKIGFDVVTIGNHEFDYGIEQLHKLNEMSNTKYISSNVFYSKNNTRIFEPFKIIEVGNKKIGFIGIVTPLTFSKTYVSSLKEDDGSPIYNFLSNKEEMYEKVQVEVDRLKNEQNVNYVVLLTHVGMNVEEYTSNDILSHLENVDAVLDGHTHMVYNTTTKDKTNKDIPITQTGTKLANIGQLIIKSDGTIINENIDAVPEPDDKTGAQKVTRNKAERWVDTEINGFITQQFEDNANLLNLKYGHSNYDFIIRPADSSDSHQVYCRFQECTLGNFIADAFKEVVNADISLVNGGSIRTNLLQGDITYQNIVDVMPFFNSIFVKEITGQALLDALEFGVSNWPNAFGGFPQVSGCTYDIDVNIDSTVEKDADGMFIRVGEQRRVSNVKINGEELVLEKKYNLSASEFILNGGDGYSMFAQFPIVNESIYADSDALAYHIQTNVEGEIPAEYNELQNRINIIKSDDIIIIHLNDVHCGFTDTIGYDGFMLYLKELRYKYKYVLTVDVGDHSQGGALGAITNGEAVIDIMNKIGFDVVTIGNHEFDYGIEQLHKLNEKSNTKYISLNACYRKNSSRIFEPSKIIEVGNKKIGFIGIVTPLTFSKTYVSSLKEDDGSPIYNFLSNKEDMYIKVQEEVNRLKNNEHVNYVILLTHVGMDVEEYTSNDILSHIENVDAVLDGHTHMVYNTTTKDKTNKDIPITQTGTKLANIGQLTIKSDETIINENINAVPEPDNKIGAEKVTRSKVERWVDTEMNQFIAQQFEKYTDLLNHKYGYTDYDFIIKPADSSDSHQVYCRFQECTLGDFIADAFKEVVNADMSLVNGGGIRTNLLKGDITYQNIVDVMPFFNSVFVKEITGQAFLDALELGFSNWPNAFGGFPQVSGCTYDVNTSIASTVEKDADGMFIRVAGERRVSNVKINGEPLDLGKKYNLSASEFILNGGDGYSMFIEFPVVNESIYADSDAIAYHLEKNLEGNMPDKYKELQNRINIIKFDDIIIIHLNDVHCGFTDTIGYDGFMLYLKELRNKYKYVLTVDVGDHSQGGALGAITNGEAVIEIMNKIGFDVVTIGNHEFDYGIEQLHKLNDMSITKYISLNACYRKNNSRIFEPSKIIEVGDKKIGFIGIVTPLTFSKTYVSSLKEDDGSPIYNFLSDKEDMYIKVQEEVNRLKNEQNVDYIILLTHIGMDVEEYTSNDILSHIEGINAVLDGHTHKVYSTTTKDKNNKDIPITQTGTKLANIGQLTIKSDGTIINTNLNAVPEPDNKTGAEKVTRSNVERWVDTEMNQFIAKQIESYSRLLNRKYGYSDYDFIIRPADSSDSHQIYCRFQECTLGNFIADAFRETIPSDVSFVNGGSIRTNLYKGYITYQNIVDVMPFYNSIFVKEITGQALLDALEFGVSNWPNAFGGFPQVSGCTYDVNTSIASTVEKDADGMFIRVGGERRVYNVKIDGQPLDSNKKYNLSASEFILNGGDGYSMFTEFPIVNESIYADSDAIAYHLDVNVEGVIPNKYKLLQNRINIYDKKQSTSFGEFLKTNFIFLLMILVMFL